MTNIATTHNWGNLSVARPGVGALELLGAGLDWAGGGYDSSSPSSPSPSTTAAGSSTPLSPAPFFQLPSAFLSRVRPSSGCVSWAQEAGSALTGCASAARGRRAGRRAAAAAEEEKEAGTTPGRSWRRARWERRGYPAGSAGGLSPDLDAAALRLPSPCLSLRDPKHGGGGRAVGHW